MENTPLKRNDSGLLLIFSFSFIRAPSHSSALISGSAWSCRPEPRVASCWDVLIWRQHHTMRCIITPSGLQLQMHLLLPFCFIYLHLFLNFTFDFVHPPPPTPTPPQSRAQSLQVALLCKSRVPQSLSVVCRPNSVAAGGGGPASGGGPPTAADEGHAEQGPGRDAGRLLGQPAVGR